jgi:hypothetical protein
MDNTRTCNRCCLRSHLTPLCYLPSPPSEYCERLGPKLQRQVGTPPALLLLQAGDDSSKPSYLVHKFQGHAIHQGVALTSPSFEGLKALVGEIRSHRGEHMFGPAPCQETLVKRHPEASDEVARANRLVSRTPPRARARSTAEPSGPRDRTTSCTHTCRTSRPAARPLDLVLPVEPARCPPYFPGGADIVSTDRTT